MAKLSLAAMTLDDLGRLAAFESRGMAPEPWHGESPPIDEVTLGQLAYLTGKLAGARPTTLNEATIWSRAIYPLLELAETDVVRAWAQVAFSARDPHSDTELVGIVDGVLAREGVLAGAPGQPFLLVMEAKRGMDAADPRPQLLAAILGVLWTKMSRPDHDGPIEAFGCFTVGDIWTFVHAEAVIREETSAPRVSVTLSWSREYTERVEADAILRALTWITRRAAG